MATAYIFLRPTTPPGFGHTGWALEADGKFYCGGTERGTDSETLKRFLIGFGSLNPLHRYLYFTIDPGQPNGAWVLEGLPSFNDVLRAMKSLDYSE